MKLVINPEYRDDIIQILRSRGWKLDPERRYLYYEIDDGLTLNIFVRYEKDNVCLPYELFIDCEYGTIIDEFREIIDLLIQNILIIR